MIDAALRRCGQLGNVRLMKGSGRDLSEIADSSVDAAVAVDTFPYLNQSGGALVESYFAEVNRVLTAGCDLIIFNYSYRGDDAADIADVARVALAHGFEVIVGGQRPLAIWDGLAFHLRKSD